MILARRRRFVERAAKDEFHLANYSVEPQHNEDRSIPMKTSSPAAISFEHPGGNLVSVRNTQLWVETEGQGEPLILLPGGPANSHVCFHPYFSVLADQRRIIYYDYRGRGRSDRSENVNDITFKGDVEDLEALRQKLGLEKISLYGFSYGGLIAQAYALEYPSHVAHLILANTLHGPEMWQRNHENINRELDNQYPEVWGRIESLRAEGRLTSDSELQSFFVKHGPLIRWYNPENAAKLATEANARNPELYFAFTGVDVDFIIGGQVAQIPDFRSRLKELSMPVLILAGRHDRALYPKLQMDFKRFCPQAQFVMLERSGTFGHVEEPDVVMSLVREFLARL
jgi:proline iminopeptidase